MKHTFTLITLLAVLLTITFLSQGCLKDNEEDLFPNTDCDTTATVSYVNDIVPMLQSQCYVCHSQLAQQGGIILEGHTNFTAYAPLALAAISKQPNEPKFMPQGGSAMDDCFKQKLQVWINRGSNNN
jgi:uncharacterized membrane protein